MGRLLLLWVVLVVAIVVAGFVTRMFGLEFTVEHGTSAEVIELFLGAAVLALLNLTLGPILKLLTLPLNCLTLGLFSLVINALILYLAGSLELGFRVGSFWAALVGSVILAIVNGALVALVPDKDDRKEA